MNVKKCSFLNIGTFLKTFVIASFALLFVSCETQNTTDFFYIYKITDVGDMSEGLQSTLSISLALQGVTVGGRFKERGSAVGKDDADALAKAALAADQLAIPKFEVEVSKIKADDLPVYGYSFNYTLVRVSGKMSEIETVVKTQKFTVDR